MSTQYDVAIAGAGPAGIAAAATASRGGATVLLIDQSPHLGGSVTAAMHRSMCGLYSQRPQHPLDTLNDSLQREIIELMTRKDPAAVRPRQFGKTWVLEFPSALWQAALAEISTDSRIHLRLQCTVTALQRDGTRLSALQLQNPSPHWITAKAIIDCTGTGQLLRLAGDDAYLPPTDPADQMLAGFSLRMADLTGDPEIQPLQVSYHLSRAVTAGLLPPLARFTSFHPGPAPGQGVCKLALDPRHWTHPQAISFAQQIIEYLRKESPDFANAQILDMSPRILPRDGLRLRGQYIMTESDILQAKKHPSPSIHAWWPIEKWHLTQGPTYAYPPIGDHYDIPLDALRSAVIDNFFAAGSCLSATPDAAASTRASGICLATGAAAGQLATSLLTH